MSGSSEVVPMDADKEPEVTTKDLSQAPWKGEPTAAAKAKAAAAEQASSSTATKADAVIDVDKEDTRDSTPAGRPADKKMPKTKAPETKAMPRAKAPRLNFETDRALKKLEEATEAKE